MTKTGTPSPQDALHALNSAEPVQEQLSLGVALDLDERQMDSPVHIASLTDDAPGRSMFVPSNRERLLRQLSALVLAPDFPLSAGVPVDESQQTLLIADGLRNDEIHILADGRPKRFPVLAEVRGEATPNGAGIFGIGDVVALHFRSEDEAHNFRFRPVDEFDTHFIPCLVGPSLFGLDGVARFSSHATEASKAEIHKAITADRVAGAVCCLLELARIAPEAGDSVAELLTRRSSVPWINAAAHVAASEYGSGGASAAIVRAFVEHDGDSPSRLVQTLGQYLAELSDPEVSRAVPRWIELADAVMANRMVLDGEILSDNRSIALRAAILAVVVDDVKSLVAFLRAARPAGMQVVVATAFLIGLKTGVADMPWREKLPQLSLMSPLLVALHHPDAAVWRLALDAFEIEPDESATPLQLVLYWRDRPVLRWVPRRLPDSVVELPDEGFSTTDGIVLAAREITLDSNEWDLVGAIDGPDGRVIDVLVARSVSGMTTLRVLLNAKDRLRKAKEIMEAASTPGVCWRVGASGEASGALYLDIPGRPSVAFLEAMSLTLSAALSLYLLPPKTKARARASKAPKSDASTAAT